MTERTHSRALTIGALTSTIVAALIVTTASFAPISAQSGPKRPRITGVAGFAAKVGDMAEARTFYNGVLGLDEAFTIKNPVGGSDLTTFKINDQQYVYVAPDLKDPNESRLLFVSFETSDARALRTYLASKDVAVPAKVDPDPEGNLTLMVKDPEGNNVQFIQYASRSVHARNKGKFLSPRRLSDHALHVGYRITDPDKLDAFYKDVLGYRLMWKGGGRDDRFDWISMIVPDGNQWIEYMVNTGTPTPRQLGVLNHLALGTTDIEGVHTQVVDRGYTATGQFKPSVGRDGRWLMHLYDKDLTRTEFMIRKPVKEPCCSPLTDVVKHE
jgi:catechol 2,3-dioxygenase-like lactoylglutathione lyase family enzyme